MTSKDQKEHVGAKKGLAGQEGAGRKCQDPRHLPGGGVRLLFSARLLPTMNDQKPLIRIYLLTDQNPAT